MDYFDYVCLIVCCIHFIVSIFSAIFSGKRIKKICMKCLTPIVEGDDHKCSALLTSSQLDLLEKLIVSLRGDDDA